MRHRFYGWADADLLRVTVNIFELKGSSKTFKGLAGFPGGADKAWLGGGGLLSHGLALRCQHSIKCLILTFMRKRPT